MIVFFREIFRIHFIIRVSTINLINIMIMVKDTSEYVKKIFSNIRMISIKIMNSIIGVRNQHKASFLLVIHSFDNFPIRKRIIPSIITTMNNPRNDILM